MHPESVRSAPIFSCKQKRSSQESDNSKFSADTCTLGRREVPQPSVSFCHGTDGIARANKEHALQGIKDIQDTKAPKKGMADLLNQGREYQGQNATQTADATTLTASDFDKKIKDLGFSIPTETDKDKKMG